MGVVNKMALNVVITFIRMAITVGIGLYTVRLLVDALGETDFGLYGLIGGGAAMIAILQVSLVWASQRHLAYDMGREDPVELRAIFSTTLVLFLAAAITVLVVGFATTPLVLGGFSYPSDRRFAVMVTWVVMIASTSVVVARAPYIALFTARQAMGQEAVLATLGSLLMLVTAILVTQWEGDRLIFFACVLLLVRMIETFLYVLIGMVRFPEGRPKLSLIRRDLLKKLLSFSGWSLLDAITLRMRSLGGNLVLNPFFGPSVNAAFTVGIQLQSYERTMARTIDRAANPVIIQSYARGEMEFVRKVVVTVSRLGTIALSALCVPLILEIDFVLKSWVKEVPQYSAQFCVAMLLTLLVEQMSSGFVAANQADGNIRLFNIVTVLGLALPLGAACLAFRLGVGSPPLLSEAILFGMFWVVVFRAWYVGARIGLSFLEWAGQVAGRCVLVIGTSAAVAYAVQAFFDASGWGRMSAVCLFFWGTLSVLAWRFGMAEYEKSKVRTWGSSLARSISLLSR